MELRSNHHLHYISAVKGGKVVKILNVARGRPTLSFKEINTILDCPELNDGSNTKAIPLVKRSLQRVLCLNMVKSEAEKANGNSSSDERSHPVDDIFIGEMTLKQLKKKCKAQKGKVSRSVDKEMKQNCGGSNHEEDDFDLEETLGSLKRKVSIKSKSRKMQKCGSASKPTVVVKCEPIPFDQDFLQVGGGIDMCATVKVEISEPDCSLYHDVSCSSGDSSSSEHRMIGKVIGEIQVTGESVMEEQDSLIIVQGPEVSKAGPVSCEHLTTANYSPEIPDCEKLMNVDDLGIIENVASELQDPDDGCSPREQSSLVAEEHEVCSLNQICFESEERLEGSCVLPASSNHESELPYPDDGCSPREQSSLVAEEHQVCSFNQNCFECEELLEDSCVPTASSNDESESPDPDDGCSPIEQFSLIAEEHQVCSLNQVGYEFREGLEGSCVPPESSNHESELPDLDGGCSPGKQSSLIAGEHQACSLNQICYEFKESLEASCVSPETSNHEEALKSDDPITGSEQPIIMPILAQEDEDSIDVLACNESPDSLFPLYESSCNENCLSHQGEDNIDSNKEYKLPGFLGTFIDSPTIGLDATMRCTRPLNHVNEAAPSDCNTPVMVEVDAMDDTDNVPRSLASESLESFELQHPPERLLSARKTISPDSQDKLCKAMKFLDLPDNQETEKCKQRLCFEKQEVNADVRCDVGSDQVFTSFAAPEHMNTADTSPNSEQKMKRGREDKKRARAKGANKFARPSWYGLSSGCVCIRSCPQNVVGFSQQQMNDIQRLASKLTKDLRSMKEIMIEMLQPEARRATTSRNNINEVRVAVENATKTEETAKRMLDFMKKDCNRFCKIVSLAEKEAVGNKPAKEEAENDSPSRGKKKITFADESGGNLCDVKFIEDHESLLVDSPIKNREPDAA